MIESMIRKSIGTQQDIIAELSKLIEEYIQKQRPDGVGELWLYPKNYEILKKELGGKPLKSKRFDLHICITSMCNGLEIVESE